MRTARWMIAASLAVSASGASACGLVFGVDGYAGSADGGSAGDGSTGEAGDTGAPGDTTIAADEGTPPDVAPPGDAAGFCPQGAIFCDDFSRTGVLGSWDSEQQTGGTLSIITGQTTPTGTALDALISAGAATAAVDLMKMTQTTIKSSVTMQFRVKVAQPPTQGGVHPNAFNFLTASGDTSTAFPYVMGSTVRVGEVACPSDGGPCNFQQTSTAAFSAGSWHTMSFTIDFTVSPAHYTLLVDGVTAVSAPSVSGIEPGGLGFSGGASYADANHGEIDLAIADFVVTGS
jgi:hypothetical protein